MLQQRDVHDTTGSLEKDTLKMSISQTSSGNSHSSSNSSCCSSSSSSSIRGEKPTGHMNCEDATSTFLHTNIVRCATEQSFPSAASTHMYFPTLSSIMAGRPPRPTECPASGKVQGQWQISLSVHQHDFPSTTLAAEMAAHAQAPIQGKEEASWANLQVSPSLAVSTQPVAYDLMADFPALRPPKKERLLSVVREGKMRPVDGRWGIFYTSNHYHHEPSYQRRVQSVPREVSSICAGVRKISLDLQPLSSSDQFHPRSIGREEQRANNHAPPEGKKSAALLRPAPLFPSLLWGVKI